VESKRRRKQDRLTGERGSMPVTKQTELDLSQAMKYNENQATIRLSELLKQE
jgi:hypothetical protein